MFETRHRRNVATIVVCLLIAVCVFVSLKASFDQSRNSAAVRKSNERLEVYVKCQAEWTNFFYKAITASREANQESAAALDNLINSISTSTSKEQSESALNTYKAARAKQLDTQTKNPLPPAPDKVCELEEK